MNPDIISHEHALETLNILREHDSFMESVGTLIDLGCGSGLDLEWWATQTTRDNPPYPLNIKCTGVDLHKEFQLKQEYPNIKYHSADFEKFTSKEKFDVLWCHDAFQYCLNPLQTLTDWRNIAADGAMLVLILPQTTNIKHRKSDFTQASGVFYHHTLVSLIHMLVITGWDVSGGYFKKDITDNWLHAVVYNTNREPMDPRTPWVDMVGKDLLPESAEDSINAHSLVRQEDLVLTWVDKSKTWYGMQ